MSRPQVIFPQRPDVRNEWDSSQAVVYVEHGKEGLERYPDPGSQAVVYVEHGKEGLERYPDPGSQAVVNVKHGKEGLERYPDHGLQAVVNVKHGKEGLEIMRPDPDVYILSDSDAYKSGEYNLDPGDSTLRGRDDKQPTVLGKKKQGNALFLIAAAVAVVLLLK